MQDLNDKITGGTLTAIEWNEVPSELQNVIESLGISLSSGDLNQLGKAIAGYVANGLFYTDSGAADAYVLTQIGSKQALTQYTDGSVFEFIAGNDNTGASTVNVAGLGLKDIKIPGGAAPAAGAVSGRTILKFDSGNDWCELQSMPIGVGQSWQNVSGSRAIGVNYTNTTGAPIEIAVYLQAGAGSATFVVDGVSIAVVASSQFDTTTLIIPNNSVYSISAVGASLLGWRELRA